MIGVPTRSASASRRRRGGAGAWACLAALALTLFAAVTRAQPRDAGADDPSSLGACAPAVVAWSRACAQRHSLTLNALHCPMPGMVLVDLAGGRPLRVELRRADARAFHREGAWGLSPVGDFADWSQVDADVRARFDRLSACVRDDTAFSGGVDAPASAPGRRGAPAAHALLSEPTFFNSVPWLLLAAAACLLAARGRARLRADVRDPSLRPYLALWVGTFTARALALASGYFHQNGQGPLWVSAAISPQYHPYGPGFRSLFGWVRWVAPRHPDTALFAAQGVLCALAPPATLFIARRMGARDSLAFALSLAVAFDPILSRLARSESYYGSVSALLLVATAILTALIPTRAWRARGFGLTLLAAALVVTQSALVHPVGWVAAALTPLPLLLGPGRLRDRVSRTLVAGVGVGAVVGILSGTTLLSVLHSPFGSQWAGHDARSFHLAQRLFAAAPPALVIAALAFAASRSTRRAALTAVVAYASLAGLMAADLVGYGATFPWIHQAYLRLYTFAAVALVAATLSPAARDRNQSMALGMIVFILLSGLFLRHRGTWLRRPTDALEAADVLAWRDRVPRGAAVAWVERVGRRVDVLPIYRGYEPLGHDPVLLRGGQALDDLDRVGRQTFYVRSSLCSTPEGRPLCDEVERRYRLERVVDDNLPAVPSMVGLDYASPTVRVGLYRVAGARQTP